MPSSTSSFERVIPVQPWRRNLLVAVLVVAAAAVAWEIRARALGYGPSLNDTGDLWAQQYEKVGPESVVIIGDSRAWFDLDLDELERGLGKRPVQLAIAGSCGYPVLEHFAQREDFRGTIIVSMLPAIWLAPPFAEPYSRSMQALDRSRSWTLAQRGSHWLGMQLEENIAFMKNDDLTLAALLKKLPIPNRPAARVPAALPPYFCTVDRERRARMIAACEVPGPLQERVATGWLALFQLPAPPSYVPPDAFAAAMAQGMEERFKATTAAVERLRARGAKVVFVRFPVTGPLRQRETELTPRVAFWDRFIRETGAPGIHFEDHADLANFPCPEWSHLSTADSVEFTKRLVPHLKTALGQ